MESNLLQNAKKCAIVNETINLPLSTYVELTRRVERLERLLMKQREMALIEMSAIEDEFGMIRTKEKRTR